MSAAQPVSLTLLVAILLIAVYCDLRWHRIPNWLSLSSLLIGLSLQALAGGWHGLLSGVLGALIGLACFMPFYLLRGMGAGDVKLLAGVGAFLAPQGAFYAAVFSLLAGGLGAIGYVVWRMLGASVATWMQEGTAAASLSAFNAARIARRDRLPFAVPIAVGGIAAGWCQSQSIDVAAWLRGALA